MRGFLKGLWYLEATVCVLAFFVTAGALMADVLAREFFGNGLFGAQRIAVWTTAIAGLLGFALVTAERGHLRPTFLDGLLPKALEPYIERIGEVVSAAICLGLGVYAAEFVQSSAQLGERGMAIPILVWPIQMVLPWMFLSSALRHLIYAVRMDLRPEPRTEAAE